MRKHLLLRNTFIASSSTDLHNRASQDLHPSRRKKQIPQTQKMMLPRPKPTMHNGCSLYQPSPVKFPLLILKKVNQVSFFLSVALLPKWAFILHIARNHGSSSSRDHSYIWSRSGASPTRMF